MTTADRTHLTRLVILFEKWRDHHEDIQSFAASEDGGQAAAYGHCAAMLEQLLMSRTPGRTMDDLQAELTAARKDAG